jgi:hypothetical protein|tara:strand:+ start:203 stop:451 length:249 start_codon:yes stop_codon:yes gene_type:complete
MLRVSNIVENKKPIQSELFDELSPKMKDAVNQVFDNVNGVEVTEIVDKLEGSVASVAKDMNINQDDLFNYFEKETNKQLGVN